MNMLLGGQGLALLASGEFEKAWESVEGSGMEHARLSEFLSVSLIKDKEKALRVVGAASAFKRMCSQFKCVYGDVSVFVSNLTGSYVLDNNKSLVYELLLLSVFPQNSHLLVAKKKATTLYLINIYLLKNQASV